MIAPLSPSVVCPVLVGRDTLIIAVDDLLSRAMAGHGQTLLLEGEAGIGKSRVTAEVAARATAAGWRVLQGHCFEPDRLLPYAPVHDLLRRLWSMRAGDDLEHHWRPAAAELVKLLPELVAHLPDVRPSEPLEPEPEKRRLFEAVTQFLVGLTGEQPVLFIIEDLHWADETSLELLLHLARRLVARPALLLLTFRSDEVYPPLRHLLAGLDRARLAVEAPLNRLNRTEVGVMLRAIFGLARPVRAEFLHTIYELTDGNPFFIEEVLRSLLAVGDISQAGGDWERRSIDELRIPRSVQDAVQGRVARLGPAAREALALAAVAGRRFDFDLLQVVTGHDERALLDLIKELIDAGLVVEEAAGRFAFRHALTRQAVYTDLLATERMVLHRAIAEALEGRAESVAAADAADLAYHAAAASDWVRALTYGRRAGDQALAMYSPRAAVEHYTRAVTAAERLAVAPPLALYRARGLAYDQLGDFDQAKVDHETALRWARTTGDRRAEWQALLDLGVLWMGRDYARARDELQQAQALARALDEPALLATSLNRLGNWHLNHEQPREASYYHHEALAAFRRLGDRNGLAETLDLLGIACFLGGDVARGVAFGRQAAELLRALGHQHLLASCLAALTMSASAHTLDLGAMVPAGPAAEAAAAGEEALAIARTIGWQAGEAFAMIMLAIVHSPQGEYGRALTLAHGAYALAGAIEHRQWRTHTLCYLAAIYLDLMALPAAHDCGERALATAAAINSPFWMRMTAGTLAAGLVAQGNLAEAEGVLDAAPFPGEPPRTTAQRCVWCARTELALARGEPDHALHLADTLLAHAVHSGEATVGAIPRLAYLRGRALAGLGRATEAEAVLQAGEHGAIVQGTRPLRWRLLAALGALYVGQRRHGEAERICMCARAVIEELARTIPEDGLREQFLAGAGGRLPRPRPLTPLKAAKAVSGGLTAREREVAVLVARGKTNREIAVALSTSERTVASHVGHILAKLDLTSRAQVAAWVIETGLATAT